MAAGAVAEQTAQIHNAQMNLNQVGDAVMNEINSTNLYNYNPVGGKHGLLLKDLTLTILVKGLN